MPINLIIRNPLDRDAREFIQRAGVTDAGGRAQLNQFVRGIKNLGLWESMVCWPLRSTQNAGTGTTAFSLGGLGTYVGTLNNGPTWGTNGITFSAVSPFPHIALASIPADKSITLFYAASHTTLTGAQRCININGTESGKADAATGVEAGYLTSPFPVVGRTTILADFQANTFYSATATFNDATSSISRFYNGLNKLTLTSADLSGASSPLGSFIGTRTATNSPFNGISSIAAYINTPISDTQVTGLHDIYRDTLGQGLSLP